MRTAVDPSVLVGSPSSGRCAFLDELGGQVDGFSEDREEAGAFRSELVEGGEEASVSFGVRVSGFRRASMWSWF